MKLQLVSPANAMKEEESMAADSEVHLKDMLDRIGGVEDGIVESNTLANAAMAEIAKHEAVCSMRYREVIMLIRITMILVVAFGAITFPQAWPHIKPFLGLVP